jgi:hypothetical protein
MARKKIVACDATDQAGFYTLPRGVMKDGDSYQIALDGGDKIEVMVDPAATIRDVDLVKR